MNKISILLIFLVLLISGANAKKKYSYLIMAYNVENLFDTENDSVTQDEEFTPTGKSRWTLKRYDKKLTDLAKVICAINETEKPALIGLSEVENNSVLADLISQPLIKELNYQIVHQDSPDQRGIDVALLYQKDKFRLIHNEFISMEHSGIPNFFTRDILYAAGIIPTGDTLHVFVNHWPSRLAGKQATEPKRLYVATKLKHKIDSITATTAKPRIVIVGDFNDTPTDKSIIEVLNAQPASSASDTKALYNLMYSVQEKEKVGSLRKGKDWFLFDQIIVSGALLNSREKFHTSEQQAHIFFPEHLRLYDKQQTDYRPHRTYQGPIYRGGTSDHFPVSVQFYIKHKKQIR